MYLFNLSVSRFSQIAGHPPCRLVSLVVAPFVVFFRFVAGVFVVSVGEVYVGLDCFEFVNFSILAHDLL